MALGYLLLALLATVVWPLGLLALGPIVLGIPHVLGDVRYLVLQPGHHKQRLRLVLVGLALAASVLGGGIIAGVLAVLLAVALSRASFSSRLRLFLPGLALLGVVIWARRPAELVFAHLHNAVAVLWLLSAFSERRRQVLLGVAFLAAVGFLCTLPSSTLFWIPSGLGGMGLSYQLNALTSGAMSSWSVRLVLVFAFAQAFHYAVWVRLIPELERKRRAPQSFRASYRALCDELGDGVVLCVLFGMVALALFACFALREARETYLGFALFHGYLELAFIAVAWLERPSRTAGVA